jgi:hypothetical protein
MLHSVAEQTWIWNQSHNVILAFASSQVRDTMYAATIFAITVGTVGSSSCIARNVAASCIDSAA